MTISMNIHFLLCLCVLYRAIYPVPAVRIFHFQDGGDVTNPVGLSPCTSILPRKCKSSLSHSILKPVCPQGQPPGMAADKCVRRDESLMTRFNVQLVLLLHTTSLNFSRLLLSLILGRETSEGKRR